MDVSPEYIKMRIAAIPDLGRGEPLAETFRSEQYYVKDDDDNYSVFVSRQGNWYVYHPGIGAGNQGRICQLERQDQLQAMVEPECPLELLNRFYRWCDLTDIAGYDNSFEQLWLAFVMKELHSKQWSGAGWG